jgi:ATP-dependent Lon protease
VVLPLKNQRDIEDVPSETRADLEFVFVSDMSEVLAAVLEQERRSPPTLESLPGKEPGSDTVVAAA